MKNVYILIAIISLLSLGLFAHSVEARGRYRSIRIGGYTSHGKGSHYIGGYVRSCHGWACR